MANEYKQCPNGHYYQGDQCPYCKSGVGQMHESSSRKTEVYDYQDSNKTETSGGTQQTTMTGTDSGGGQKTVVVDGGSVDSNDVHESPLKNDGYTPRSTVFGDNDEPVYITKDPLVYRETRKLVGWLVSYTLDSLGVDFKLYEGRNIIGRDMDCNITVNDNRVSSRHAVLLFRAGKYSITDSQSSHGTFVNNQDIELEPYYLSDGDVIQMGETIFKFRSAL